MKDINIHNRLMLRCRICDGDGSAVRAGCKLMHSIKGALTVEAAVHGDKDKALLALIAHPLIMDYDIAKPLLNDILEANRDFLPQFANKAE